MGKFMVFLYLSVFASDIPDRSGLRHYQNSGSTNAGNPY